MALIVIIFYVNNFLSIFVVDVNLCQAKKGGSQVAENNMEELFSPTARPRKKLWLSFVFMHV